MPKLPVTVCIIAKNEERHIEQCLTYLKKYEWEVVVTDTGSTDRTREIAAQYADKVADFEWVDDFAAARNFCASHASNNWILAIDCDEFVKEVDVAGLRTMMQRFPRHVGIIRLKNLVIGQGGSTGYVSDDVTRLYNKNFYHYISPIHEQLRMKGGTADDIINAFVTPIEAVHHGYALRGEDMERKQRRNLDLLYKAAEREPENGYHYFQIGQSNFVLGNMDEAIAAYEKGMALVRDYDDMYVREMVISLAKAYDTAGRVQDALGHMAKYSGRYGTAKFTYEHARILQGSGQVLKALMLYIKVTALKDLDTIGGDLVKCYGNIIDIYRAMGNEEMAAVFRDRFNESLEESKRIMEG